MVFVLTSFVFWDQFGYNDICKVYLYAAEAFFLTLQTLLWVCIDFCNHLMILFIYRHKIETVCFSCVCKGGSFKKHKGISHVDWNLIRKLCLKKLQLPIMNHNSCSELTLCLFFLKHF